MDLARRIADHAGGVEHVFGAEEIRGGRRSSNIMNEVTMAWEMARFNADRTTNTRSPAAEGRNLAKGC